MIEHFTDLLINLFNYSNYNHLKEYEPSQIEVGQKPVDIVIPQNRNITYVVNNGDDTVSIISLENNTKIKDIPVGKGSRAISINSENNIAYLANTWNDTVSIISLENNTKVGKDIPVGKDPVDIAIEGD